MRQHRKILLVGGAGYIGSVMSSFFLQSGWHVRSLDDLIYKNESTVWPYLSYPEYEFMRGDVRDPSVCARAVADIQDVVILAGLVGDPVTNKYPSASESINLQGIRTLLYTLGHSGVERVAFVSTCSNYGLVEGDVAVDENFPLAPLSLYAKHKVEVENVILESRGQISYTPTVLRFATAFGVSPRMRFDLTVNEFARELYLGNELLVFDATTWRPYCHVRDFCRAVERVLQASRLDVGFEVFNVGSEESNFTKQMIVDEVAKNVSRSRVRYQQKGADPRNYRVNFAKIRRVLGFKPEVPLPVGVIEILSALDKGLFDHVEEQRHFFGNYEVFCPHTSMFDSAPTAASHTPPSTSSRWSRTVSEGLRGAAEAVAP